MTPAMNSAQRIHDFCQEAISKNPGSYKIAIFWNFVLFGEKVEPSPVRSLEITRRLGEVHRQLDLAVKQLDRADVPAELFEAEFNRLYNALSPSRLHEPGADVLKLIDKSSLSSLLWASWVLGRQEKPANPADLIALAEQIKATRALIKAGAFPIGLADMVLAQLHELDDALAAYGVAGIEPLRKAMQAATGELVTSADDIREALDKATPEERKTAMQAMSELGQKASTAIRSAATTAKAAEQIIGYGQTAVTLIKDLMN